MSDLRLDPEQLVELADLIAARLRPVAAGDLVDAAALAARLGVTADYVYRHADELGARRLGVGPRARLRFDVAEAEQRLTACSAGRESGQLEPRMGEPKATPRRRRRSGTGVELLPVRGLS